MSGQLISWRELPAIVIAILIGLPVLAAIWAGIAYGGGDAWQHIATTKLWTYTATTCVLLVLTGTLILLFAVPAAWAVTMYDFPGRRIFEWLLILPLAAPGYVIAYAWADLSGVAGPFQSAIQDTTGLRASDYWFPEVTGLIGCSFVLACALYPYVYLTARTAFTTQSASTLDAARSLGASRWRAFRAVALPSARPAIAAGLALALMEAAADYGAADFLGVQTLTVGIVKAHSSFNEAGVAARMALILLAIAFLLQWLEKYQRGQRGAQTSGSGWRAFAPYQCSKSVRMSILFSCILLFILTFAAPIGRLIWISVDSAAVSSDVTQATINSILLAGGGALLAFVFAVAVALAGRSQKREATLARLAATAGYATPGAVLALGGFMVAGYLAGGRTETIALMILIWIYATRFTIAGAEPMMASLSRAPASMTHAAQSLGASPLQRMVSVDLPIAMSGAAAGALILFVEALKELPATMMLRPSDWDTLATKVHFYATDDALERAAIPSVAITLAGLGPVILLSRRMSRSRPGASANG